MNTQALCHFPFQQVRVTPDAGVTCCHYQKPSLQRPLVVIGNLEQSNFNDVWFGHLAEEVRAGVVTGQLHRNCRMAGCPVYAGSCEYRQVDYGEFPSILELDDLGSGLSLRPQMPKLRPVMPGLRKLHCNLGNPFDGTLLAMLNDLGFREHATKIHFSVNTPAPMFPGDLRECLDYLSESASVRINLQSLVDLGLLASYRRYDRQTIGFLLEVNPDALESYIWLAGEGLRHKVDGITLYSSADKVTAANAGLLRRADLVLRQIKGVTLLNRLDHGRFRQQTL